MSTSELAWLIFIVWMVTSIFAVGLVGNFCWLGQHEYEVKTVEGRSKWSMRRYIFKCSKCGEVE